MLCFSNFAKTFDSDYRRVSIIFIYIVCLHYVGRYVSVYMLCTYIHICGKMFIYPVVSIFSIHIYIYMQHICIPSWEQTYPIQKAVGKMNVLSHWWDVCGYVSFLEGIHIYIYIYIHPSCSASPKPRWAVDCTKNRRQWWILSKKFQLASV